MHTLTIQKVYDAFKAKDLASILELQANDTEWSVAGPADKIPWASTRRGKEGVTDFIKILGSLLVPEVFEIHQYFENGDTVVALGFQKGYVRSTSTPYEFDFVHVWELEHGIVRKFRVYYDSYYVVDVLTK
jgi:uncharacterized protein